MSMKLRALSKPADGRADDANVRPNRRMQLLIVGVVALCVWFGYSFLNRSTVPGYDAVRAAAAATGLPPESTPNVVVVTATPTATVEPTWTPSILYAEVTRIVEVTREVTRYVSEPYPVEVTRIVEVTPTGLPTPVAISTPTPAPLPPGTVRICAEVEGARELYIGGSGVASGECRIYSFGVGQTSIQVQVNK